ncbi:uncharacterized protein isoform X6 [Choristoneura fumiferana]|uniref:uncharacterized protein isoform X6 n=1 Tax=Choristoneura fumiferana TaxID=7141 RepID=UPI003D15931A
MRLTSRKQVLDCEERFKDMYSRNLIRGFEVKDEPLLSETEEMKEEIQSMDDEDDDTFLNFNDGDDDLTSDLSATADAERKTRSKGKAKSKPKKAKQDKKTKTKRPIKDDETELTEAAVSGEKKKGPKVKPKPEYYTRTADDRYDCNHCDKTFVSQPLVSQHYRFVHQKKRPRERKCPHCDARVPGYLRAYHLEEAHGIPAPKCGVCNKKFRYPCHVVQHQKKVHMGEKTVACEICSKSFFNNLSLRLHMVTHSTEKKFKCGQCEREFRWENNLKDHMKIHTGDKRYVCVVCEKAFVQKSTLKQHVMRNHRGLDVALK